MSGKAPAMEADVRNIIKAMPDSHIQKAKEASLFLFALQTGKLTSNNVF